MPVHALEGGAARRILTVGGQTTAWAVAGEAGRPLIPTASLTAKVKA